MPYKDPEQRRAYNRKYMQRFREEYDEHTREQRKEWPSYQERQKQAREHSFIGVDGEGWTDSSGHHHYMCLVVGEHVLYTGRPLATTEILEYLCLFPQESGVQHVSYYFDYDVTMILRDMVLDSPELASTLFINPYEEWVTWKRWKLRYIPRKSFTVLGPGKGNFSVHDVGAFFQCSFVKAITEHSIGTESERAIIAEMKDKRDSFDIANAQKIIAYSQDECRLLAELVMKLQSDFVKVGMSAMPFEGPGPIAGRALDSHLGKHHADTVPLEVIDFANRAYYGGRFEVSYHGSCKVPIYEYDIKSAYPDAMTKLPCLKHGTWIHDKTPRWQIDTDPELWFELWVGFVRWDQTKDIQYGTMGPLPFRKKDGRILFPMAGQGWYWSTEVPAGAWIQERYIYQRNCECEPFTWVQDWYYQRQAMEKEQKGSGIGLKLTLNSLYGKFAQRIGKPRHLNPVWAGLITAMTRAKIYNVYLRHPRKVVMFATDAVFTTEPIDELELGTGLGEWELAGPYNEMCIFLPGIYFDGKNALFKTRGVPKKHILADPETFKRAANDHTKIAPITLSTHQGIRLTLHRGEKAYSSLGDWIEIQRKHTANPISKRETKLWQRWSKPYAGDKTWTTRPYTGEGIDDPDEFNEFLKMAYEGTYDGFEPGIED